MTYLTNPLHPGPRRSEADSSRYMFGKRTSQLRRDLVRRGGPVPFTLDEFREWILKQAPALDTSTGRCCYCDKWITAASFSIDHRIPLSRQGGPGLDNLAICCRLCNRIKGVLLWWEYIALLRGLEKSGFTEKSIIDLKNRLAKANELADATRRLRAQVHTHNQPNGKEDPCRKTESPAGQKAIGQLSPDDPF